MTQQLTTIEQNLAQLALSIGAIKVTDHKNPFTWASKWKTPMYNDNRKHLGFHTNREVILHSLGKTTREIEAHTGSEFDYILGTSTSAIAWGALLAHDLDKHFIITHGGQVYEFVNLEGTPGHQTDVPLLTNAPWGIPNSVIDAHYRKRPFMYQRSERKTHGMENKIEGNPEKDSTIDTNALTPVLPEHTVLEKIESYFDKEEYNFKVSEVGVGAAVVNNLTNLNGKKVLIIEDLISTGGSTLKEVGICRKYGGIVTDIIAIYNYEFPIATQKAKDANVTIHNLLTYEKLLEVAIKENYISEDKLEILREWREDPEAWSDKYCGTNFTNNGYEKLAGV